MRRTALLLVLCIPAGILSQPKIKIRVVDVKPRPPAQPEPGDSVTKDARTGEILAESRGHSLRIRNKSAEIAPVLSVGFGTDATNPGLLNYQYKLTNLPTAQREVFGFILKTSDPSGRDGLRAPTGWLKSSVHNGQSFARMEDSAARSYPNSTIGSFGCVTSWLPGVVTIDYYPKEDPLIPGSTPGDFVDAASEWVRASLLVLHTQDYDVLTAYAIGPKISPAQESIGELQRELRAASGLIAFQSIGQNLLHASYKSSLLEMKNEVSAMQRQINLTELQTGLLNALQFRIGRLQR